MLSTFLEFIKTTGIFLICAESILYFVPGSSYQKYVKVLIGIMVLAQFVVPLKALVTGQEGDAIERQVRELKMMLEEQAEEMQMDELQLISEGQEVNIQTADEIKSRLNSVAAEHDYVITDVIIDDMVHVTVSKEPLRKANEDDIRISKIEIGSDNTDTQGGQDDPDLPKLQELFCEALGTGKAYLEVRSSG